MPTSTIRLVFNNDLMQILLSFVYAIILAPWNDPIYFIVWLILLEIVYLSVFTLDPMTQLGVVSAYLVGWIVGRQLMMCYEDDPFVPNTGVWNESNYTYSNWLERLLSMFNNML